MADFNYYQIGGSLEAQHPTYVVRQADFDLYEGLKNSDFCYILNSRQMGKSSLRVRILQKLKQQGVKCASIDLSRIGTHVNLSEWYGGVVSELLRSLGLLRKVDLGVWWRQREFLPPKQRLSALIDDVLLTEFPGKIVIFIDEIDSILKIKFKDDFFAFIRACYNQRADNPEYKRLTFCLLGVATPSDLIADKNRTPFNIGRAIELTGFQLHEVVPLVRGLKGKVTRPIVVLQEVLKWTSGQPFLTQKLCQLVCTFEHTFLVDKEAECVENLVRSYIIQNWETQDEPEHLRTIRDRLLQSGSTTGRLLGLYQQILQQQEIPANHTSEQTQLQLTGLVVKQQGKLQAYNRIYTEIFNQTWLNRVLANLRPYAEVLNAWVDSNFQDESRLLRGQTLQDARTWGEDKSLSDLDRKFLDASQELEKRDVQKRLETEAEATKILAAANEVLFAANQKAKRQIRLGLLIFTLTLVATLIAGLWASKMIKSALQVTQLENLSLTSNALFQSNQELDALIVALKAAIQLKTAPSVNADIKKQVTLMLQQAVYDIHELNRLEAHTNVVEDVNFSADGKLIASASGDGTVILWGSDGRLIKILKGHKTRVISVTINPVNKIIASGDANGIIKFWNQYGQELKSFQGHGTYISSIRFSPDGKTVVSGAWDTTTKLWDLQGKVIKNLKLQINDISFSPDGRKIAFACGGGDNTVKVWNIDSQELKTIGKHNHYVNSVAFSPDGKMVASASSDETVKLWSLEGQQLRTFKGHENYVNSVAFSHRGNIFASSSGDGTVRVWNLNGQQLKTFKGHKEAVNKVAFSPDGKIISSASGDNTVKIWSLIDQEIKTLKAHSDTVNRVSFSPNGKMIASVSDDRTIKLWNQYGQEIKTIRGFKNIVNSVSFSPDGKKIVSSAWDNTLGLWSLDDNAIKVFKGHNNLVYNANFSPDSKTIASASIDGTIRLWNLQGQVLKIIKENNRAFRDVSFSPAGTIIASANQDGTVNLWNLHGQKLQTLKGHNSYVTSVRFNSNGTIIASASHDKTIKLWNLAGQELKTFIGHNAGINQISFSPDDKIIASASADKTIKLWSLAGQELKTLTGHNDAVLSISFSPDGKVITSGSEDKTIRLWNAQALDFNQLMIKGCKRARNYLKNNLTLSKNDRQLCDRTEIKD